MILPGWMRSFGTAHFSETERADHDVPTYFVVAGPAGAGVHFHQHNQGFNILLTGSKRY